MNKYTLRFKGLTFFGFKKLIAALESMDVLIDSVHFDEETTGYNYIVFVSEYDFQLEQKEEIKEQ